MPHLYTSAQVFLLAWNALPHLDCLDQVCMETLLYEASQILSLPSLSVILSAVLGWFLACPPAGPILCVSILSGCPMGAQHLPASTWFWFRVQGLAQWKLVNE